MRRSASGHENSATGEQVDSDEARLRASMSGQVRTARRRRGLSLAQLAVLTGVSKSMLSKIENGQTTPGVVVLNKLSDALDVPMASFFGSLDSDTGATLVRAGAAPEVPALGGNEFHVYHFLGGLRGQLKRLEPFLVELKRGAKLAPPWDHDGVEFLFVISGRLKYAHGNDIYELSEGDALEFESSLAHGPYEVITPTATYISVTAHVSPSLTGLHQHVAPDSLQTRG